MDRTRSEHVRWAKERALEYVERGQLRDAVASMLSDLRKHSETAELAEHMGMIGIMEAAHGTPDSVRRFIKGFAE